MRSNINYVKTVAIAAGGTVSASLRVGPEFAIVGFRTDAAWLTANLTIASSMEDESTASPTDFLSLVDDQGAEIQFNALAASKQMCTSQGAPLLVGNFFKFTSSVTQTAGSTLSVIVRPA